MTKKTLEIVIFIVIGTILQLVINYKLLSLETLVVAGLALVISKIMSDEIVNKK